MGCLFCGSDTVRVILDKQSFCLDCYNAMIAADLEIELPELPHTFAEDDVNGVRRIFEVERQITGTAILLTARERWKYGYEFAVDGELDANQQELFNRLMEKTKLGLSETYLEEGKFLSGEPYTTVKDMQFKGILDYDAANSDAPLVIIDGKPYTWDEVGRLLQAFEGFQVKIEMKDMTDEM